MNLYFIKYPSSYNLLISLVVIIISSCTTNNKGLTVIIAPSPEKVNTNQIQQAIDSCHKVGGGTVHFEEGLHLSGGLHMKSNVTLELAKGAIIQGSSNLQDYGDWKWTNALIMGEGLKNISIIGAGTLDGIDLKNPEGEGGMRGPHCIRLTNCDSIKIDGITIIRSANWAMNFRYCGNGIVQNVKVRGGHDAFHTRFCNNFVVRDCDFRTGDDCFAGNDNRDFYIENCNINSSCNAFRFGCLNLVVKKCNIWGPGEYPHISQNRNNTLSAFVHFSPADENPKIVSGNWLIQDVTVHHVDNVFNYNFKDGLWQTGQPLTDITFENLHATEVKKSFNIVGDSARSLDLTIKNSSFIEIDNSEFTTMVFEGRQVEVPAFFNATEFGSLHLENVALTINSTKPALSIVRGGKALLNQLIITPEHPDALLSNNIMELIER